MAKQTIQDSISIAAGASVNVISGKRFENVKANGLLSLLATASAVGLRQTLFVSNRNAVESSAVSDANRIPIEPDDMVVNEVDAVFGEKIFLEVTNPTGAAVTYFYRMELDDNVISRF